VIKNASANLLDGGDESFDREMRRYFRQVERRTHQLRLTVICVLLWLSLVINGTQFWLYNEALKICGVRP
jgi:hypothetical protein